MLLKLLLVFTAFIIATLASPLNTTLVDPQFLNKRSTPGFKKGDYTKQQIQQIKEGHSDAIKMASMVVKQSSDSATFDPIFKQYFAIKDKEAVINVFKQIVGPKDDGHGHGLLGDITFVKDSEEDNGELACDEPTADAELFEYDTDKPKLVVCPRTFTRGALSGDGYPNAPVKTCDSCYPRISWKMETIGMILLHEYTHWDTLMTPVMLDAFQEKATLDTVYGCWKTRIWNMRIGAIPATWNADSYAWLANEVWWTQACVSEHGALTAPEYDDNREGGGG